VPRDPGNLSAFGLLTVDVKVDHVQTYVARHGVLDLSIVSTHFGALRARAAAALAAEGFDEAAQRFERTADLRYFGQAYEVRVPFPDPPFSDASLAEAERAFHDAHEQLYGYCFRDRPEQEVEWVNVRVTGVGPIRRPDLRPLPTGAGGAEGRAVPSGHRDVCFDSAAGYASTPTYARDGLLPGVTVVGPAIIEEYGATVPLHPGFRATVDHLGNLIVAREDG
jgi:N-methylhydantoinase A